MKWDWRIALPYLLGLGLALVEALLHWLDMLHVSAPTAVLSITLAKLIGDYIRSQLLIAQNKQENDERAVSRLP